MFDGLSLEGGDEEAADDAVDELVNAIKHELVNLGISATVSRLIKVALVNLIFQLSPIEGSRISPNFC